MMTTVASENVSRIVLGSRSPQRQELLAHLVDARRTLIRPPASSDEAGFDDCADWPAIEQRLSEVVRGKSRDVERRTTESACILTADTVIVGERGDGRLVVLGQPPEDESWRSVVRDWFRELLLGRTHTAATTIRVVGPRGEALESIVRTQVTFCDADDATLEWYLDTEEPRGKAGGYALQGAGGLFVDHVDGSLTNVVGLPLRETRELLQRALPELFAMR